MKRPSTSRDIRQSKQKQAVSLLNMINSLLYSNNSTQMLQVSNYGTPSASKIKINFNKQTEKINPRLLSSQKIKDYLEQKKNNFFSEVQKSQQKQVRPKSSIASARQYRSSIHSASNHKSAAGSVQPNITKLTMLSRQVSRNISSKSQSKELQIQYNLVQIGNALIKSTNKCPKTIISTRSVGAVRGYGVNSHKFFTSSEISEGRALIISNLTKTQKLNQITSLYSIFQCSRSVQFMDFVREHIQPELSKKLQGQTPVKITKQVIQSCLQKVQKKFCQKYALDIYRHMPNLMSITNSFGLSFAMVFIRGQQIVICTKGLTQVKLSQHLGGKLHGQSSNTLTITTLYGKQLQSIDFIAIISQGINKKNLNIHQEEEPINYRWKCSTPLDHHQNLHENHINSNKGWFQRQIWKIFIDKIMSAPNKQKQQCQFSNIHELVGSTVDTLYRNIQKTPTSKNVSIILLSFRSIAEMLLPEGQLELPLISYVEKEICETEKTGRIIFFE